MPDLYDVVVAGAGPAGGTAAYFLGEAGKRVLVLEKAALPRYKACGGGVSLPFLQKTFPFSFEPVIERDVRSITYAFAGQATTVPLRRRTIQMVMRDRFDAHLLAHAKAEVRAGTAIRRVIEMPDRVRIETSDGSAVEGRYLIGADGANSVAAHSVGLRRGKSLAAAIEAEVRVPRDVMRRFANGPVFIFGEIELGYLWIFPKADHLSAGIAALRPKRGELQATLQRVMARYGISLEGVQLRGHPIPLYRRREQISTARVLLAGDAAGLVDPFSGEGIRLAITSGRLAAEAILAGHPEQYGGRIFRRIGLNHTLGLGVAALFYNLQDLCLTLGAPNPATTEALMDLLSGRASYPEVMLRAIGTLPTFMLGRALKTLFAFAGGSPRRGPAGRSSCQCGTLMQRTAS